MQDKTKKATIRVLTGTVTVIGTTRKTVTNDFLREVSQSIPLKIVNIIGSGRVNKEKCETLLQMAKADMFVVDESQLQGEMSLSSIAKENDVQVVVISQLSKKINHRLSNENDFAGCLHKSGAALLIGFTDEGIVVNKNQFGGKIGEISGLDLLSMIAN